MKRIGRAKMRKIARKVEVTVQKVLPPPREGTCYAMHDGYLMQFQKETRNEAIFLEDLYRKVRGDTIPEAVTESKKQDLDIKLRIRASDISLRAMDQEGVHLDLDSRDTHIEMLAEFGPEALIVCQYTSLQPRDRHDYSRVRREYSWKVVEIHGTVTAAHVAALYRRVVKHGKLKFNLVS